MGDKVASPLEGLVIANRNHQHLRQRHEGESVSVDVITMRSWQFRSLQESSEVADGRYFFREDLVYVDPILNVPPEIEYLNYHEGEYRIDWEESQGIWIFSFKRVRGMRYDGGTMSMEPLAPRQELGYPLSIWGDQVKISGTDYQVTTRTALEESIENWRGEF
tara:strand:- start:306 stop:794 length:489 start_codon:yes stop_codon:yes gene_type:complete